MDKVAPTLRMIGELEAGPGAFIGPGLGPTDLELGWVNATYARWLHRRGLIQDGFREGPIRLTDKGRCRADA